MAEEKLMQDMRSTGQRWGEGCGPGWAAGAERRKGCEAEN